MKLHPIPSSAGHILILLLLLCAVCVAPGMAGSPKYITEDGVHLTKYADSPTQLDPNYYRLNSADDVVVEGNQYYWVRIGNVKAEGLTSVWWSMGSAIVLLFSLGIAFSYLWYSGFKRYFPTQYEMLITSSPRQNKWQHYQAFFAVLLPILCVWGFCCANDVVVGAVSQRITHAACGDFVDLQASDGTILLPVDKLHPETNTLYMKSGLNLTTLTHIPSSGNIIQNYGVSPP